MRRLVLALIGAGGVGLSGCGTFSDAMCGPISDHTYYRGVRFDVAVAKQGGAGLLFVADIPFSAVADTLLIPHYARIHREAEANSRRRREATTNDPADTP